MIFCIISISMQVICSMCGKTREKPGESADGKASHGQCAKCAVYQQYRDGPIESQEELREEMKTCIRIDLAAGSPWEGSGSQEYPEEFDRLFDTARAEIERERGVEGSRT